LMTIVPVWPPLAGLSVCTDVVVPVYGLVTVTYGPVNVFAEVADEMEAEAVPEAVPESDKDVVPVTAAGVLIYTVPVWSFPAGRRVNVVKPVPVLAWMTVTYGPVNVTEPLEAGVCTKTVPVLPVPVGGTVNVVAAVPVPGTVTVV
jgi:hypothetical protein